MKPNNADSSPLPPDPPNRRRRVAIPSTEDVLPQMVQLLGAIATGLIPLQQGALMLRILTTLLNAQSKQTGQRATVANQEALLDVVRRDPRTLNSLAPFLTDQLLDDLFRQVTDDNNGPEAVQ